MIDRIHGLLNIATVEAILAVLSYPINPNMGFGFALVAFVISLIALVLFLTCDLEKRKW
jgi:hypothetical protein